MLRRDCWNSAKWIANSASKGCCDFDSDCVL